MSTIKLAHVGLGRWGPNLLRAFASLPGCAVTWVCDANPQALVKAQILTPDATLTSDYTGLLADANLDAVVLAVPAVQHFEMARQALLAGKHVFVEKPLTLNLGEGERLVALAAAQQRTLMVGHLLEYHPAVTYLKSLLERGDLGALRYIYAQRLNLGVVRQDENAMWSLAPHDISVMLYLLGCEPEIVAAHGVAYLRPGVEDVVFLTLRFPDNHIGHIHVSWLDPHKVRRLTLVGTHRMAEFDDMESSEKVRIYDHGVDAPGYSSYGEALTLRFGDIVSPRLDLREPLRLEAEHFVHCLQHGVQPRSDGQDGLRVLRVLTAAQESLASGGVPVAVSR